MMREADPVRIEIDVQHLAGPGGGHLIGGRGGLAGRVDVHDGPRNVERRIEDQIVRLDLRMIARRDERGQSGLGCSADAFLHPVFSDQYFVFISVESGDESPSVIGGCPFGQTGPRRFRAGIDLLVGELRHQIRVEANSLSGQNEGMRIPLPNEWRSFRGEEPDRKEAGDRGARLHDEAAYSLGPSALSWSAKRLWSAGPWQRFEGGG